MLIADILTSATDCLTLLHDPSNNHGKNLISYLRDREGPPLLRPLDVSVFLRLKILEAELNIWALERAIKNGRPFEPEKGDKILVYADSYPLNLVCWEIERNGDSRTLGVLSACRINGPTVRIHPAERRLSAEKVIFDLTEGAGGQRARDLRTYIYPMFRLKSPSVT